jgi:hypothetical protein
MMTMKQAQLRSELPQQGHERRAEARGEGVGRRAAAARRRRRARRPQLALRLGEQGHQRKRALGAEVCGDAAAAQLAPFDPATRVAAPERPAAPAQVRQ